MRRSPTLGKTAPFQKATDPVRFVSFNVNGIRARQHQLEAVTERHSPDVLALQETKVVDDDFPLTVLENLGYPHVAFYGQKGHYGVAIASRVPLEAVQLGVPWRRKISKGDSSAPMWCLAIRPFT